MKDNSSGQHDPVEFFENLINHIDSSGTNGIVQRVFDIHVIHTARCPIGHLCTVKADDSALRMLLVHPTLSSGPSGSNVPAMMENYVNGLYSGETTCDCSMLCEEPTSSRITKFGSLLAINVVWPIAQSSKSIGTGVARRLFAVPFPIHTKIDLSSLVAQTSKRRNVSATLVGALCRVGGKINQGHYVCIVSENNNWWKIDNEHVSGVSTTSEFFDNAQTPVLLLYRLKEYDNTPSEPPPTKTKTAREVFITTFV